MQKVPPPIRTGTGSHSPNSAPLQEEFLMLVKAQWQNTEADPAFPMRADDYADITCRIWP